MNQTQTAGTATRITDTASMEYKIKDLLGAKITDGEMDFLRGFYRIPGIYRYSMRNCMLIMIQGGSIAMGFDRWLKLGRHVKRGAKANIEILIPHCISLGKDDEGQNIPRAVNFFGRKVFDISQTYGKDLEYQNNSQEVIAANFDTLAPVLQRGLGIKINTAITGSARGYFKRGITAEGREICISIMSNNSDKCKTLFHELGHALLHDSAEDVASHPAREVEAELTSLLVCSVLGVEFKESELYIKAYNTHKPDVRVLKVISAVQKILKAMEPQAAAAVPAIDPLAKLRAKKYKFISDPGHGWLEVPQVDILTAGIQSKISGYSYINKGMVYLEEDCDAGLFIDAVKLPRENCIDVYAENTPIRDYQSYNGTK